MKLPPRYLAVLRHVARYRLTLRAVIGKLLLPATGELSPTLMEERRSQGGNVLARLASYGLLNHHHHKSKEFPALTGNVPYFTLTPAGAKEVGAPAERAEELGKMAFGTDALETHLATLWFAYMQREPRHRLEPAELASLFGSHKFFENVPHCLARDQDGYRIYRIYVASTNIAGAIGNLRKQAAGLLDREIIRDWLPMDYGICDLAAEERMCLDLQHALERSGLRDQVGCIVSLAPSTATLRDALRTYEGLA
jgi:hypothetical protein